MQKMHIARTCAEFARVGMAKPAALKRKKTGHPFRSSRPSSWGTRPRGRSPWTDAVNASIRGDQRTIRRFQAIAGRVTCHSPLSSNLCRSHQTQPASAAFTAASPSSRQPGGPWQTTMQAGSSSSSGLFTKADLPACGEPFHRPALR